MHHIVIVYGDSRNHPEPADRRLILDGDREIIVPMAELFIACIYRDKSKLSPAFLEKFQASSAGQYNYIYSVSIAATCHIDFDAPDIGAYVAKHDRTGLWTGITAEVLAPYSQSDLELDTDKLYINVHGSDLTETIAYYDKIMNRQVFPELTTAERRTEDA